MDAGFAGDIDSPTYCSKVSKITQIYEGTNQIQRVVIAKKLLG